MLAHASSSETFNKELIAVLQAKQLPLQVVLSILRFRRDEGAEDATSSSSAMRKLALLHETITSASTRQSLEQEFPFLVQHHQQGQYRNEPPLPSSTCATSTGAYTGPFVSFSKSKRWQKQATYYEERELNAWDSDDNNGGPVPFAISSNAFVAHLYLDLFTQIVAKRKHISSSSSNEKGKERRRCAIVEIGAGHCILSLLLAKELSRIGDQVLVIATDMHSNIFNQLLQLPWVIKLCQQRCLDFAVCAATEEGLRTAAAAPPGLDLLFARQNTSSLRFDKVCCIANYAFDSFPQNMVLLSTNEKAYDLGLGVGEKKGEEVFVSRAMVSPCPFLDHLATSSSLLLQNKPAVLAVPSTGIVLLEKIKCSFPRSRFSLIVGECIVQPDDAQWQARELDHCVHSHTCTNIDTIFDPPFISPHHDVLAMPLSLAGIHAVFSFVFGRGGLKQHGPLASSSFSVLCCDDDDDDDDEKEEEEEEEKEETKEKACKRCRTSEGGGRAKSCTPFFPHFGPNEFLALREFLLYDADFRSNVSLDYLHFFLESVSMLDFALFFESRWLIRKKLACLCVLQQGNSETVRAKIHLWTELGLACFFHHACLSIAIFLSSRAKVVQWLLSLSSLPLAPRYLDALLPCLDRVFSLEGLQEQGFPLSTLTGTNTDALASSSTRPLLVFSRVENDLCKFILHRLQLVSAYHIVACSWSHEGQNVTLSPSMFVSDNETKKYTYIRVQRE